MRLKLRRSGMSVREIAYADIYPWPVDKLAVMVKGNTFPIKDKLKREGFRWKFITPFSGAWVLITNAERKHYPCYAEILLGVPIIAEKLKRVGVKYVRATTSREAECVVNAGFTPIDVSYGKVYIWEREE